MASPEATQEGRPLRSPLVEDREPDIVTYAYRAHVKLSDSFSRIKTVEGSSFSNLSCLEIWIEVEDRRHDASNTVELTDAGTHDNVVDIR